MRIIKFCQIIMALVLICSLSSIVVSCSNDDNPTSISKNDGMSDPDGELAVNGVIFEVENQNDRAELIVTYIAPNGLYMPDLITIEPVVDGDIIDKKSKHFWIGIGTYTVTAGGLSQKVEVRQERK